MPPVSPALCGLQAAVPGAALSAAWQGCIGMEARMLAAMLHRLQSAVAGGPRRTAACRDHAAWLQVLTADTERFLTAQVRQHVRLERELGQLRTMVTDLCEASSEAAQRVRSLERVIEVRHANLAAARQYLATLRRQEP